MLLYKTVTSTDGDVSVYIQYMEHEMAWGNENVNNKKTNEGVNSLWLTSLRTIENIFHSEKISE